MPAVVLAPLVGWDAAGYRLGYGGGIYPQLHDVRVDAIVTEAGVQFPRI